MNIKFTDKKFKSIIFSLLAIIFTYSCSSLIKTNIPKKLSAPSLSKIDANKRKSQISEVQYKLIFDLSKNENKYSGTTQIQFNLDTKGEDLRIDFHNGEISSIKVNDKIVQLNYNTQYLVISDSSLLKGFNKIEIDFTKKYSRDGSGFYRFVDPEDKRIYTYTDLEPYDANKVFPCFDQPNLKANYTMKVHAPSNWKVITSTLPSNIHENQNSTKTWDFPKSALFSTYIWSLHAGPYHEFIDSKAKYPSRVFVRESMKEFVKIKDWNTFTRQGFEFFNEYFGYEYPYKKYDQVIVPDFNAGAMENVAAVTFSEGFIKRGIKSQAERRKLANVIFHEMAHMWFGNLVTMNWWNDLWLNESFATYTANLGLSRNTEFKDSAWRAFNKTKRWAYWEDQLVTTHPIEAVVPDTSQAFANFDGITYGKGAASLKQIHYYLGEKGFKKGIQLYFKKHANSNTQLKDFIKSLEKGSDRKLGNWQKKWLQTEGVNTIAANYSCVKNKITSFSITQTAPKKYPHIRPHAFQVALLKSKKNRIDVSRIIKVEMDTEFKSIDKALGLDCPDIVFPNYGDHDYIRVKLDQKSLGFLEDDINKVASNFLRQMLWSTLRNMVYFAQYDYKSYLDIVLNKALPKEKDPIILKNLLTSIHGKYSNATSVLKYSLSDRSLSTEDKEEMGQRVEKAIWKLLKSSKSKSDIQKILFSSYVKIANSHNSLNNLKNLLAKKISISGLKIDQDKRWSIIEKLNSYNYSNSKQLLQQEMIKDKSSLGKKHSIASKASYPTWKSKKNWIEEFKKKDSKYSFAELRSAIYNLFPREQYNLRSKYSENFFKDMKWVNDNKDTHVAKTFTALAPNGCSVENQKRLLDFINDTQKSLKPSVLKALKIIHQESTRCKAVLNLSLNNN